MEKVELKNKLIDEFMWCATSLGQTSPLAPEVVNDIVEKHIEMIMPYLQKIDKLENSNNKLQKLFNDALAQIKNREV